MLWEGCVGRVPVSGDHSVENAVRGVHKSTDPFAWGDLTRREDMLQLS